MVKNREKAVNSASGLGNFSNSLSKGFTATLIDIKKKSTTTLKQ